MNLNDPPNRKLALVVGATGGIGGEVAHALIAHGWRVRGLCRRPGDAKRRAAWVGAVEWVSGDAMDAADVTAAASGAAIIFHGANPPQVQKLARPRDSDVAERHCGGAGKRRAADLSRERL